MNGRAPTFAPLLFVASVLPSLASAAFITTSAGGTADPSSIQAAVDTFRTLLGDPLNGNAPGPLPGGRREINWDGGGATTASPAGTPFAGFQLTRGALFATPGTGFLQTPLDAPELLGINPTYGTTFGFFSPVRIFTPVGSNTMDVTFFIPGSTTPAVVRGFGAVFTDVDLGSSATMTFFDVDDNVLFNANVLPGSVPDGSLSFLGAIAAAGEEIARVRLTLGTTALGPTDDPSQGVDVVALDDFLYGEPFLARIDEPSVLMLLGAALIGFIVRVRRRKTTTAGA